MSAVPDPAVIAKLANEFFAALPGAACACERGVSSLSPPGAGAIPTPRRERPSPDYPRETFSSPAPNPLRSSGTVSHRSALNEADFRAIAASLAGELPLAPQVTTAAPPAAILALRAVYRGRKRKDLGPPRRKFHPPPRCIPFPAFPAMPASRQQRRRAGRIWHRPRFRLRPWGAAVLVGTDPWAEDPHFAGLSDVYFRFLECPECRSPLFRKRRRRSLACPRLSLFLARFPARLLPYRSQTLRNRLRRSSSPFRHWRVPAAPAISPLPEKSAFTPAPRRISHDQRTVFFSRSARSAIAS
jgi:hypothetical protein